MFTLETKQFLSLSCVCELGEKNYTIIEKNKRVKYFAIEYGLHKNKPII